MELQMERSRTRAFFLFEGLFCGKPCDGVSVIAADPGPLYER